MKPRKSIMLMLTEQCNLRCLYCYEDHTNGKTMSFETAKEVLDKELTAALTEAHPVRIEFFGGEVMLVFELLVRIYDYVNETYDGLDVIYAFTTNGTLFDARSKDWFYKRKERFVCTLSVDGTPRMHDRNRKTIRGTGSSSLIDLDFFINTWPDGACTAKMTVGRDNLEELCEGVMFIEGLGMRCKATLASGTNWQLEQTKEIWIRELRKLSDYYVENRERNLCSLLDLPIADLFYEVDREFRFCGAGCLKHCFDTMGDCYPCQGLTPLAVGDARFKNEKFGCFCFSDNNPCGSCKWIYLCGTCYAANFKETRTVEYNSEAVCYINRLCILTSSYIQYMRLEEKMSSGQLTLDEERTAAGICMIQEELPDELGLSDD